LAGAKDDSRDAEVMASALRTDPSCFRELAIADPVVIELREWSCIAEDLSAAFCVTSPAERARLGLVVPRTLTRAQPDASPSNRRPAS
jgi:hypothetical protein